MARVHGLWTLGYGEVRPVVLFGMKTHFFNNFSFFTQGIKKYSVYNGHVHIIRAETRES